MQKPTFELWILTNRTLSYNGLMVHHWSIFFFFLTLSVHGLAQDERYYRQILNGQISKLNQPSNNQASGKFNFSGPNYKFDLDEDNVEESIQAQKREGIDWLVIKNSSERRLFEAKIFAMGAESSIFKIKVVHISDKVRAAIIFLDEGQTAGKKFESTGRIFVLSFENNDLGTLTLTEGPHFFHEKESQREQYWRKDYLVNIFDIDGDGIREVSVQYNNIQRILKYVGKGEWKRL